MCAWRRGGACVYVRACVTVCERERGGREVCVCALVSGM